MCGWRSSITLPSRKRRADVAGEVVRIGIVRDRSGSGPSAASATHRRLLHRRVGEIAQADIAADEARGDAIGRARICRRSRCVGRLLGGERLPQPVHGPLADVADHLDDVVGLDAARAEPPRAVDVGMRHGPAGIELEGERLRHPARAEIAGHRVEVARRWCWRSRGRSRARPRTPCAARRSPRAPAAPRACPTAPPSRRACAWSRCPRRDIR